MPLSLLKLFHCKRRIAESIQTPILESTAKKILEKERHGIPAPVEVAAHLAAKKAGFGLFNFLGGAGS